MTAIHMPHKTKPQSRKRSADQYSWPIHPTPQRWDNEQWRVFQEVALPKIKKVVNEYPLGDLLMFAYLLGLNHMLEATEREKSLKGKKDE